ncbi:MAG: ABC transporter ATP-binding protein [Promethearchaeota archaeon]
MTPIVNNSPVIELHNVSKQYQNGSGTITKALQDVSFSIHRGEIFGLIGPNGAGKTTTIKILVGLIHDFEGQVIKASQNREIYKILGYLPQEAGFQEWRTVNHALTTFGLLSGIPKEHLPQQITEILTQVGLNDVLNKKIMHLSGGMQQKLRLAQALLHHPEILILDEPMTGLDPTSRFQMKTIIGKLAAAGITILFSSHILSDVEDIATRIGILNYGKMLTIGTTAELQAEFQIGNEIAIEGPHSSQLTSSFNDIDGVESVSQRSVSHLRIRLTPDTDVNAAMAAIMQTILDNNCKVHHINLVKPSLEEVYLKYVGGTVA